MDTNATALEQNHWDVTYLNILKLHNRALVSKLTSCLSRTPFFFPPEIDVKFHEVLVPSFHIHIDSDGTDHRLTHIQLSALVHIFCCQHWSANEVKIEWHRCNGTGFSHYLPDLYCQPSFVLVRQSLQFDPILHTTFSPLSLPAVFAETSKKITQLNSMNRKSCLQCLKFVRPFHHLHLEASPATRCLDQDQPAALTLPCWVAVTRDSHRKGGSRCPCLASPEPHTGGLIVTCWSLILRLWSKMVNLQLESEDPTQMILIKIPYIVFVSCSNLSLFGQYIIVDQLENWINDFVISFYLNSY